MINNPFRTTMNKPFILFTLLIALLAACSPQQKHYRIGVSQCLDDAWRQKMNYEMERELLLHPDMTLSTRVAYGSNTLQCAQIDSFIAERVDLLIVSPNETDEVRPAVTRAYRAGIPVIVADRSVGGNEWTAFIGGDNHRVGQLIAEWLIDIQHEQKRPIHVLEVTGLTNSAPTVLRHEGMMQRLGEEQLSNPKLPVPAIASVMGSWQKQDAYNAVYDYLKTHNDIEVIVAHNDLMAVGAAEAVADSKNYSRGNVRISGVDGISVGLQAIADGIIECTASYSSRGDMVIETAARILAGKPFVRDTVLETTMIDANAARALLLQYRERLHDLETLKIVQLRSDSMWQRLKTDRVVLISIVLVFFLLLILALIALSLQQKKMQAEIKNELLPQLEDVQEAIQLSRRDELFAARLRQLIDDHLGDPKLNVEYLGSMLQLSRTQVFRRVKAITGKGPLEYIRERRLIKADYMLRNTDMTVQQVALELCFSSPGYFTKCYKEYFGHLPSTR